MSDLSPGQEVTVSPNATAATVVYVRYDTARVRFTSSGRERTVALCRVTPKRESKALSVEGDMVDALIRAIGGQS